MATKTKDKKSSATQSRWNDVTQDDLANWADPGSLQRGEGYFDGGNVESIALTQSGELLAWVEGNERYAVQVALAPAGQSPRLASLCTCPVGYACKHAVAAVLTLLDAIARGKHVPIAGRNDPRLRAFDDEDSPADWNEQADNEWADESEENATPRRPRRKTSRKSSLEADLRAMLAAKSHDELIELVLQLTDSILNARTQLDSSLLDFSAMCIAALQNRPERRVSAASRRRQKAG